MSRRAAAVAALAWLAASSLAGQEPVAWWAAHEHLPAGFHTIEVDSVYPVSGATRRDVLLDMERKGPASDDLGPRLGIHLSQWQYGYEYELDPARERCRLTEARVLLRSVIVTPRWVNVAAAPDEASRGWRTFLEALRLHEEGHRNRAKAQGVFLWQGLLGLEAATCEDLGRRVRATAERVIEEGRAEQRAYDRETGHGLSQGARWP